MSEIRAITASALHYYHFLKYIIDKDHILRIKSNKVIRLFRGVPASNQPRLGSEFGSTHYSKPSTTQNHPRRIMPRRAGHPAAGMRPGPA